MNIEQLTALMNKEEQSYAEVVFSKLNSTKERFDKTLEEFKEVERELIAAQGAAQSWVDYMSNKYVSPPTNTAEVVPDDVSLEI